MSDAIGTLLPFLAATAVAGVAVWIYLGREPAVRGRGILAALRASVLALLVLLLWNPSLPFDVAGAGQDQPGVLVDASLSMSVAVPGDTSSLWSRAVRRARELAGPDGRVLLFGSAVRPVSVADLREDSAPNDVRSLLAPALERVASLGGSSVEVISDFRLEDPVAASAAVEAARLGVRLVDLGGSTRNAGIVEVVGPSAIGAGEQGAIEVVVAGETGDAREPGEPGEPGDPGDPGEAGEPGEGAGGASGSTADSVDLEVRLDDELHSVLRVPLPDRGRTRRETLAFEAPSETGPRRLEVAVSLAGDVFPTDDRRVHYLDIESADRASLVLLSFVPDWEPRYLLPVLEQVTGLEGRGFLLLTGDRWLSMGQDEEIGGPTGVEAVQDAAAEADILVLHGLREPSEPWVGDVIEGARRLLVLPGTPEGAGAAGVEVADWSEGEWYVTSDLPSSALAGELSGVTFEGLPPLTAQLRPLDGFSASNAPILLRSSVEGSVEPGMLLSSSAVGRRAVVLASGFWRWGARGGDAREAYRRLWAGVAGWLLEEEGSPPGPSVAPAERPTPRGQPIAWRARGLDGDSVAIRVSSNDSVRSEAAFEAGAGTVSTAPLPPGRYEYSARAAGLPEGESRGTLEVTAFSDDLLRPRVTLSGATLSADEEFVPARRGPGRPLRTHPLPYVFLLGLLSVEWIGRRRQGLR